MANHRHVQLTIYVRNSPIADHCKYTCIITPSLLRRSKAQPYQRVAFTLKAYSPSSGCPPIWICQNLKSV